MMEQTQFLLPEEASEMTLAQVAQLRALENRLRPLFAGQGYQELLPPSFEYVDLYRGLDAGFEQEKMFQFINHEGRSITLRYDFTVPIARQFARTGGTELARFAYFGKVYRKEQRHKARRTEAYQIGVELLGAADSAGDQECLQLALATLEALQLKNVVLEIGSAAFYRRLCELVGHQFTPKLSELLSKKDLSGLEKFVKNENLTEPLAALLLALPLTTDLKTLSNLTEMTGDAALLNAIADLKNLELPAEAVFDLSMVPAMGYYTGLMFAAYSNGVAQPILSGGRYDELLARFGVTTGAIGFCCQMDNVLKACENEKEVGQ